MAQFIFRTPCSHSTCRKIKIKFYGWWESFLFLSIINVDVVATRKTYYIQLLLLYHTYTHKFSNIKIRNSKDVRMLALRLKNFISLYTLWASFLCNYDKSVTQTCLFADWMYSSWIGSAFKRIISTRSQQKIFDLNTKCWKYFFFGVDIFCIENV
jgi:hypothetical protein